MLSHICPCRESARRGPRCARRFVLAIEALHRANMDVPAVRVAVLKGGFDQWVRRFWKNPMLVQGYDDEYWGYAELEVMRQKRANANIPLSNLPPPIHSVTANQPATTSVVPGVQSNIGTREHANEALDVHRSHSLYSRPTDQPATPWSGAGSDIERAIAGAVVPGISDSETSGTIAGEIVPDASEDVCDTGADVTPPASVASGATATLPR